MAKYEKEGWLIYILDVFISNIHEAKIKLVEIKSLQQLIIDQIKENDWFLLNQNRKIYKNFTCPVNFKRILENIHIKKNDNNNILTIQNY